MHNTDSLIDSLDLSPNDFQSQSEAIATVPTVSLGERLLIMAQDYERVLQLPESEQDCSDIATRIMAIANQMMEE